MSLPRRDALGTGRNTLFPVRCLLFPAYAPSLPRKDALGTGRNTCLLFAVCCSLPIRRPYPEGMPLAQDGTPVRCLLSHPCAAANRTDGTLLTTDHPEGTPTGLTTDYSKAFPQTTYKSSCTHPTSLRAPRIHGLPSGIQPAPSSPFLIQSIAVKGG